MAMNGRPGGEKDSGSDLAEARSAGWKLSPAIISETENHLWCQNHHQRQENHIDTGRHLQKQRNTQISRVQPLEDQGFQNNETNCEKINNSDGPKFIIIRTSEEHCICSSINK
jgi:hypothetical protein